VTWFKNGKPIGTSPIPESGDLLFESDTNPGDWFTLVVYDGDDDPTVFANAIYVR
jgi:hypothetical protein